LSVLQSPRCDFADPSSEDRWREDGGQGKTHEEKCLIAELRYPLYLIANDHGVLVSTSGGKDCVLLFHRKELAERHILEAELLGRLYPLAIRSKDAFREGLESLPREITCAVWDATVVPHGFIYMDMADLFLALENA
jgi:hypothetical protein